MLCKEAAPSFPTSPKNPTYLPFWGLPRTSHKYCFVAFVTAGSPGLHPQTLPLATGPPQDWAFFLACPLAQASLCTSPATLPLQTEPLDLKWPLDAHRAGVLALDPGPAHFLFLPLFL